MKDFTVLVGEPDFTDPKNAAVFQALSNLGVDVKVTFKVSPETRATREAYHKERLGDDMYTDIEGLCAVLENQELSPLPVVFARPAEDGTADLEALYRYQIDRHIGRMMAKGPPSGSDELALMALILRMRAARRDATRRARDAADRKEREAQVIKAVSEQAAEAVQQQEDQQYRKDFNRAYPSPFRRIKTFLKNRPIHGVPCTTAFLVNQLDLREDLVKRELKKLQHIGWVQKRKNGYTWREK